MLDRFPQRDFGLWIFLCPINFSVSLFLGLYHSEGYHAPPLSFPATTPRATTPHLVSRFRLPRRGLPRPILTTTGYHACVCIPPITPWFFVLFIGHHTRAITLNHTRTSGYLTRHSSPYFIVYLSPAITPPVLLHLHHHRGATRTNLLHRVLD